MLLSDQPRTHLAVLPTPAHPLDRLTRDLNGPEIWLKRDDMTGLAGGGNKTRKLEFLVGDALQSGADTLVTVGAIQSNHTRQTAAAAAKTGLDCLLLHNGWTQDAGRHYREVGNILLSHVLGAELHADDDARPVGDLGRLDDLADRLRSEGRKPYVIPVGGSDHPLGSMGYVVCAAEIAALEPFDYVVHCTGSSSTQAGLLAGFAAIGEPTRVIGLSDDDEATTKQGRVLRLANETLAKLGVPHRITPEDVEIHVAEPAPYGVATERIMTAIKRFARTEGIVVDPVYEGRTILGLCELVEQGRFQRDDRILVLHLGGTPAIHAYAESFGLISSGWNLLSL